MLDINIQTFKIKYVLVRDQAMLNSAVHMFRSDVSEEFKRACLEEARKEKPSATLTLALGDECQAITITDDNPIKKVLFSLFGLDIAENNWDDFTNISLEQDIKAVVLDGQLDDTYLNNYILAFYNGDEYYFVPEHFSFINEGKVKRPLILYSSNRDMLDVCLHDLKYDKEHLKDEIERIIHKEDKKLEKNSD